MQLFDKRLIVVAGKGGVGKSSVAAALALGAARAGKRVLCCEVNAKERIAPLLGARPTGPVIQEAVCDIFTVNVKPRDAMREYAIMKLRFESVYKAVFENRIVRHFLRMVPSLAETVMLGKVWYEVEHRVRDEYKWDLVILDAPATGHAMSLLGVPRVLLDTVPPGPMRDDAAKMQATLSDPEKTRIDLVSLPEEMPVNETMDLAGSLRSDLELPLGNIYLNEFVDRRFSLEETVLLRDVALEAAADAGTGSGEGQGPLSRCPSGVGCRTGVSVAKKVPVEDPDRPRGSTQEGAPASAYEPEPATEGRGEAGIRPIARGEGAIKGPPRLTPAVAAARAGLHHVSWAERSIRYEERLRAELRHMPVSRLPLLYSSSWGREQIEILSRAMEDAES